MKPKTCYSKHLPRIKALLATDLTENYRVQLAAVLSAIETNQKLSGLEQLEDFLDMLEQK